MEAGQHAAAQAHPPRAQRGDRRGRGERRRAARRRAGDRGQLGSRRPGPGCIYAIIPGVMGAEPVDACGEAGPVRLREARDRHPPGSETIRESCQRGPTRRHARRPAGGADLPGPSAPKHGHRAVARAPACMAWAAGLRILSERELNRALLARQLLLERLTAPIPKVLERMGTLQAQYAPSMYVGSGRGWRASSASSSIARSSGAPSRPGNPDAGDDPPGLEGGLLAGRARRAPRSRREAWLDAPYRRDYSARQDVGGRPQAAAAARRGQR